MCEKRFVYQIIVKFAHQIFNPHTITIIFTNPITNLNFLAMRKKITIFLFLGLVFFGKLWAQDKEVTGCLEGADGTRLPGVTVIVKGTFIGTITDGSGCFKLTVPAKFSTISFSMIGMKTKDVEVTSSTTLSPPNTVLEQDLMKLNEVVVTALGISKEKKQLGYSVQDVRGEELVKSGEPNLVEALSGKVAGIQVTSSSGTPGASAYMLLRGSHSLSSDNQPIIVIDGIPIDNGESVSGNPDEGLNNLVLAGVINSNRGIDIDPDDVESVTVLKGPAAAALYGLRAANGAILVTSKKGHTAVGKSLNVGFNSTLSFDMVNKLPEMQMKYAQGSNGVYHGPETLDRNSWGPAIADLKWNGATDYPFDKHGQIVSASDPNGVTPVTPYDNMGTFFKTGVTTNNNLNLSGGNGITNYYFSASHLNQTGVIPTSDFQRTSVRIAGETSLSAKFKASGSINYIHSGGHRVQQGSNLAGIMLGLTRTAPTFDNTNGVSDPVNDSTAYQLPDGTPRAYRPGVYDNPYWTINKNPFKDDVNRMIGNVSFSYTPYSWLSIIWRLGNDFYTDRRKAALDIYSGGGAGQVFEDQHFSRNINSDLMVTASKKFSEKLSGSILLGNNMFSSYSDQLYSQGDGLVIPSFYNLMNASSIISKESIGRMRTAAWYLDGHLDYMSMLYLDVTGRNEWVTTLPENQNPFFFPSTSLGFVFTEAFLKDNKILPYGKLRASYAKVGNGAAAYSEFTTFNNATYGDGWSPGTSFPFNGNSGFTRSSSLGSSDLIPEMTSSTEIGTELKFLKNRLGLDFTYYSEKSDGEILAVPVAASTGYREFIMNAGTMTNKGIELSLYATPIKCKDFSWDITVNFSKNKNMVTALAPGLESLTLGGFETPASRAVVGQPNGILYGGRWLRDTNGHVVIDDEGTPATNPNYGFPVVDPKEGVIGDPNPKWLAGIRNTVTYKGFALSFLIDIRKGGDIWNGTEGALVSIGTSKTTETRGETKVFDGVMGHLGSDGTTVVTSGTTNTTPVVLDENWYRNGNGSGFGPVAEQFIQDGGWVRLRDLSLAYTFNPEWLKKCCFKSLTLGVSGRNLWLKTKYTGVDPETNLTGTGSFRAEGFEYFNNPGTKSMAFSLRSTF